MAKICAIITKNGTLEEIKKLINPYEYCFTSKRLLKSKDEWINDYKEEITTKLNRNTTKIKSLNKLIKKSKFKEFYEIEKNDLLKINSDLENVLNVFNNDEELIIKEMRIKTKDFVDKDGNLLTDKNENYYFRKINLNSMYTKILTTKYGDQTNSCKIKDLVIDFKESEQKNNETSSDYELVIWDGAVNSENKYLWDSVYAKECFPVDAFLSKKQGLIKDLPIVGFDSVRLILNAIEKENPEYYITIIEYSDDEMKKKMTSFLSHN